MGLLDITNAGGGIHSIGQFLQAVMQAMDSIKTGFPSAGSTTSQGSASVPEPVVADAPTAAPLHGTSGASDGAASHAAVTDAEDGPVSLPAGLEPDAGELPL